MRLLLLILLGLCPLAARAERPVVRVTGGALVAEIPMHGDGEVCATAWTVDAHDFPSPDAAGRAVVHGDGTIAVPLAVDLAGMTPQDEAALAFQGT